MTKQQSIIKKFLGLNQSDVSTEDSSYSPYMINFRITDRFELMKRDGFYTVAQHSTPIRAIWCGEIAGNKQVIYVTGGKVYSLSLEDNSASECGEIEDGVTNMFAFGGTLYIQNGVEYYKYDGNALSVVEGYIPLIAISSTPSGGGTPYETINMLTDKRRQLFSSDYNERKYELAEKNLTAIVKVTVNGKTTNQYEYDLAEGYIEFFAPQPSGLNNIEVTYRKAHSLRERIVKCAHSMMFGSNADTRVFLWGNESFSSYRFHSELADGVPSAEYFPELNYTSIGSSSITDIVQQYDRQLIFTPESAYYSYCDVRTDSAGKVYSSFPVFSLNSSKGNLISGSSCDINGKPVTLCRDGVNIWESTAIENEKTAICFSSPICEVIRSIQASNGWNSCRLFDFQSANELYFSYDGIMYIYNYRLGVWYAYDGIDADTFCDCFGELLIAGKNGCIYKYDQSVNSHEAIWKSFDLNFSEPCSRKDISSIVVTLAAVPDTELTLECLDGEERSGMTVSQTFSPPYNGTKYVAARKLRIAMRRINTATLSVKCASGKSLTLKSIGIITQKKGDAEYGI